MYECNTSLLISIYGGTSKEHRGSICSSVLLPMVANNVLLRSPQAGDDSNWPPPLSFPKQMIASYIRPLNMVASFSYHGSNPLIAISSTNLSNSLLKSYIGTRFCGRKFHVKSFCLSQMLYICRNP